SLGGRIDCLFAYYYAPWIVTPRPWPACGEDPGADVTYFCFEWDGNSRPRLPFRWVEIAAVPLDRNHHSIPERVAVVGCRLPRAQTAIVASTISTQPNNSIHYP